MKKILQSGLSVGLLTLAALVMFSPQAFPDSGSTSLSSENEKINLLAHRLQVCGDLQVLFSQENNNERRNAIFVVMANKGCRDTTHDPRDLEKEIQTVQDRISVSPWSPWK